MQPSGPARRRRGARPVWDYAGGMTLLRRFWDAALHVDPEGAAAHDEGRVMRFCSPHELRGLWVEAGLADVDRRRAHRVRPGTTASTTCGKPLEHGVGPAGAYAASLDRAAARSDCATSWSGGSDGQRGPFTLDARAWRVAGRVPGSSNCGIEDRPAIAGALTRGGVDGTHGDISPPRVDTGRLGVAMPPLTRPAPRGPAEPGSVKSDRAALPAAA